MINKTLSNKMMIFCECKLQSNYTHVRPCLHACARVSDTICGRPILRVTLAFYIAIKGEIRSGAVFHTSCNLTHFY